MESKSISDWEALAIELFDVLYFDPQTMVGDGNALFLADDFHDCIALEKQGSRAASFQKAEIERDDLLRCRDVFSAQELAFVLIVDKQKRERVSGLLSECYPGLMQFIPDDASFAGISSIADMIDAGGNKALDNLLMTVRQKPVYGLLELADVRGRPRRRETLSGIRALDAAIGGFAPGELSVWTGVRGSGKSTIAQWLLLEAVNQGQRVCAYSGELPAWQFRAWSVQQAAGPAHVREQVNPRSGKTYYTVDDATQKKIDAWWRGKYYLYDNEVADANSARSIMTVLDLAAHRYGCSIFLCDNLMTARFSTNDKNFYREQSEFTGTLVSFAKKNNVHVHLVAHPRKMGDKKTPDADDVGGSGDITNRADNVFSITRIDDEKAGFDAGLTIRKNRDSGATGKIKLNYHAGSRRHYELGGNANKRLGWDTGEAG